MDPATILKQAARTKNPDVRQKLFSLYKKQKLIRDIKTCTSCRLRNHAREPVPWSGPVPAPIAVVGEGPGVLEDKKGAPFVGSAGQLLNKLLKEIGLDREKIFVFNTVCCRPPNNRTPLPDELAACRKYLRAQLDLSEAKLVILLGATALSAFKPGEPVSAWRGRWFTIDDRVFFVTYHPAAALRSPDRLKDIRQDFQVLKKLARIIDYDRDREEVNRLMTETIEYVFNTCPEVLSPANAPALWEGLSKWACRAYNCRNMYLLELVLEKEKELARALAECDPKDWPEVTETAAWMERSVEKRTPAGLHHLFHHVFAGPERTERTYDRT